MRNVGYIAHSAGSARNGEMVGGADQFFAYRKGELYCEGVSARAIAEANSVRTGFALL